MQVRAPKYDFENITKEQMIEMTNEAKNRHFLEERRRLYLAIYKEGFEGGYNINYTFERDIERSDKEKLCEELSLKGFEVTTIGGFEIKSLLISWNK